MDLFYLAITLLFFIATFGFLALCQRLMEK
jgi:hypothetical protein